MICYINRRGSIFGDACRQSERLHLLDCEGEDGEAERRAVAYRQCPLFAPRLLLLVVGEVGLRRL
jgi:hypothetical protein